MCSADMIDCGSPADRILIIRRFTGIVFRMFARILPPSEERKRASDAARWYWPLNDGSAKTYGFKAP